MNNSLKILSLLLTMTLSFFSASLWAEDDAPATKEPIYFAFTEPFTINFLHQSEQQIRYIQIKVSLMSYDQEAITNSELNEPMLQDALRMLFSQQTMDTVTTIEGRVALQKMSLELVQQLLKKETGNDDIEAVYFTSFILQ